MIPGIQTFSTLKIVYFYSLAGFEGGFVWRDTRGSSHVRHRQMKLSLKQSMEENQTVLIVEESRYMIL